MAWWPLAFDQWKSVQRNFRFVYCQTHVLVIATPAPYSMLSTDPRVLQNSDIGFPLLFPRISHLPCHSTSISHYSRFRCQAQEKALLIIPTSDPEPSQGFPNYPANRGSLRSQSPCSYKTKLESATHIGDHPKIPNECWKRDHVGDRQPACSCRPPEVFVAVCLHVCGPIASVRLPTHQISSLPSIFETTSNVSVGRGTLYCCI